MKLRRTSAASGSGPGHGPVSIEDDGRSPQRDVVAERADLELVVIATDLPRRERLERVADHGADLLVSLRPAFSVRASS